MKKIRMVALDFDWTLVDYPPEGGYEVAPETLEAVNRIIADGDWAGLVSGRDVWPMHDILTVAGVRWGKPFPNYYIRRENYLHYQRDGIWVEDIDWNNAVHEKIMSFCLKYAGEIPSWLNLANREGFYSHYWVLYSDFGFEVHYCNEKIARGAQQVLTEALKNQSEVALHRNRMMLNIVPAGTGKGMALSHAAEHFSLAPHQVVAVGDSDNDISMLDGSLGFHSGTVFNSTPTVKKIVLANGGYVAAARASHGVYQVLKHYVADGLIDAL